MEQSIRRQLDYVFCIITGVSLAGVVFVGQTAIKFFNVDIGHTMLVFIVVIIPLLLEAIGAFGLVEHWFDKVWLKAGKIIGFLQWIAGIFGAAAIFDGAMRLMKRIPAVDNLYWFTLDTIFIILFFSWMIVSYLINEYACSSGKCEFC